MGAPARQDDVSRDRRTGGWRRHLSYANVAATLALVFAMGGGTAIAAQKLITGEQIAKGTITADNIKAHSLQAKDFKAGQLPSGARGPAGAAGATGAAGPVGTPGVPGAPGAPGANGSTVFWGDLRGTGSNNAAAFNTGLTNGFTSATWISSQGAYCITPPVGAPNAPLVISDNGNEVDQWDQVAVPGCTGDGLIDATHPGTSLSISTDGLSIVLP
jgi:hypothetical protein